MMKKLLILIICLIFTRAAVANPLFLLAGSQSAVVPTVTYLINEGFEGTGFPTESFNSAAGAPAGLDYDYTADALSGSKSLYADYVNTVMSLETNVFASSTTLYVGAKIKPKTIGGTNQQGFIVFYDVNNIRGSVFLWISGAVSASPSGGTIVTSSAGVLQVDTTVYLKVRAVSGTGSNSTMTVWTSTDGTLWTERAHSSNGTFTGNWEKVGLEFRNSYDFIVDDVKVANEDFNM